MGCDRRWRGDVNIMSETEMRSAVSAARRAATAAAAASTTSTGGGQGAALSKGELQFISQSILYLIAECQ